MTPTKETPLELPGLRALAFGDRIVGVEGGLRFWMQREPTDERRAWFRRVAVPRLSPLLEIDFDRALVTHGKPVLEGGHEALDAAAADFEGPRRNAQGRSVGAALFGLTMRGDAAAQKARRRPGDGAHRKRHLWPVCCLRTQNQPVAAGGDPVDTLLH